ncbi:predicted protein, partial [Arabidopsis lyrata subsp. lyrata]
LLDCSILVFTQHTRQDKGRGVMEEDDALILLLEIGSSEAYAFSVTDTVVEKKVLDCNLIFSPTKSPFTCPLRN